LAQLPHAHTWAVRPARRERHSVYGRVGGQGDRARAGRLATGMCQRGIEGSVEGCSGWVGFERLEEEPEELAGRGEAGERVPAVPLAANAERDQRDEALVCFGEPEIRTHVQPGNLEGLEGLQACERAFTGAEAHDHLGNAKEDYNRSPLASVGAALLELGTVRMARLAHTTGHNA